MAVYYNIKPCKFCGGAYQPVTSKNGYCSLQCICLSGVVIRGSDECWGWIKATNGKGYGDIKFQKTRILATRAMWQLFNGPIPEGLHVLHHCDNPACCNPNHLWLGSHKDNMSDRDSKGRHVQLKGEEYPLGPKRKLSAEEVIAIRASADTGPALAKRYGVRHPQIYNIKHRRSWKHI